MLKKAINALQRNVGEGLKAKGTWVIVDPLPKYETTIELPETVASTTRPEGVVVSVGSKVTDVNVGEYVGFHGRVGRIVEYGKKRYVVLEENEVWYSISENTSDTGDDNT